MRVNVMRGLNLFSGRFWQSCTVVIDKVAASVRLYRSHLVSDAA
jgi:hypothetical protein